MSPRVWSRRWKNTTDGLQALAGRRVLIPRAEEAREVLPEALDCSGNIAWTRFPATRQSAQSPVREILRAAENPETRHARFHEFFRSKKFCRYPGKRCGCPNASGVNRRRPRTRSREGRPYLFGKCGRYLAPRKHHRVPAGGHTAQFYGRRRVNAPPS